jgi:hypothetical protein
LEALVNNDRDTKGIPMGVSVLERRPRMIASRPDKLALLGMARNMFSTIPSIRDAESYEQAAEALLEFAELKLNKKDPNWEAQHANQLRVRGFNKDHHIK